MNLFTGPLLFLFIVFAFLSQAIRILKEYERGVVFRLGRAIGAKGPGVDYSYPGNRQDEQGQPSGYGYGCPASGHYYQG